MEKIFRFRRIIENFILTCVGSVIAILIIYKVSEIIYQKLLTSRFQPQYVNLASHSDIGFEKVLKEDDMSSFKIAVAPIISPESSLSLYAPLAGYIGKAIGKKGKLLFPSNYLETNNLIRYGQCDIAFGCTYHFVLGARDFGLELLTVPVIRGEQVYYSLIITPKSDTAKTLLDLKGKRFACEDIHSTTGWLYAAIWLNEHGENPFRFFSAHIITGSMDNTIRAVATGYVDCGAVGSIVYQNMPDEIIRKVKVIQKSPPFGAPPVVVNPKMAKETKNKILKAMLEMHNDPEGKKILSSIGIDRFVEPEEKFYDSIRRYVELLEAIEN